MEKVILGFAGEISAGKGTATEFVKSLFPLTLSFRFSDSLREYWAWFGAYLGAEYGLALPSSARTRDLQQISTKIRELFGENALERAIAERVKRSSSESPIVIIEGIRRRVDISELAHDPRYNFHLIYIEADPRVRWERFRLRNEKPGDALLSFDEFLRQGEAEAEAEIRSLRPLARHIIDNSGPPEMLNQKLVAVMQELLPHHTLTKGVTL